MNHAIKDVADSFPPVFEKIKISLTDRGLSWSWNDKHFWCYKNGRGYILCKPNNKRVGSKDKCYIKKGLEYLAPVLRMPNIQVNHFSLRLFEATLDPDDLLAAPLNAKSVYIYGHNISKVAQFLSAMSPGYLESICLDIRFRRAMQEDTAIIFETEQFKQAKSVDFKSHWKTFNVEGLGNFRHLQRFQCHMRIENTMEDVPRIRDLISTFEEFESCELRFSRRMYPMRTLAIALGEQIPIGPLSQQATINHRYRIPESNEYLEFEMKDDRIFSLINVVKIR
ncbi:hypothetical protein B9Z55_027014 [Caenorhabditis nigoni]|uniref:DUF38 domain-containing protein n=1 Tax=Caenorhabditis nigoni TaxID=1611254 RepID=A0A2G5SIE5_9PELO|nr:hypothetical protein B9Z55_027014 [Caenorhabditis nigoni]